MRRCWSAGPGRLWLPCTVALSGMVAFRELRTWVPPIVTRPVDYALLDALTEGIQPPRSPEVALVMGDEDLRKMLERVTNYTLVDARGVQTVPLKADDLLVYTGIDWGIGPGESKE